MKESRPVDYRSIRSLALVGIVACSGCTHLRVLAPSPDNRSAIAVREQPFGPDSPVWIRLGRGVLWETLYSDRADGYVTFVEVVWTKEHADILVCRTFGPPPILISTVGKCGADCRARLAAAIRRRYGLTSADLDRFEDDPVKWACAEMYSDAATLFRRAIGKDLRLPSPP